jgi:hypothetical protein
MIIVLPPILSAYGSLLVKNDRFTKIAYSASIVILIYSQFIIMLLMSGYEPTIKKTLVIIWIILVLACFYPIFYLIIYLKSLLSIFLNKLLRKLNIQIIRDSIKMDMESEYVKSNQEILFDIDKSISSINADIINSVNMMDTHKKNIANKYKEIDYNLYKLSQNYKKISNEMEVKNNELDELLKLKKLTKDQVDILLKRMETPNISNMIISFILGIVTSIIGSIIFGYFQK